MTRDEYLALSRQRLAAYKTYKFWDTAANRESDGVFAERCKAANEYNRLNELCREWEREDGKSKSSEGTGSASR